MSAAIATAGIAETALNTGANGTVTGKVTGAIASTAAVIADIATATITRRLFSG